MEGEVRQGLGVHERVGEGPCHVSDNRCVTRVKPWNWAVSKRSYLLF